jgi:hypothetical protein
MYSGKPVISEESFFHAFGAGGLKYSVSVSDLFSPQVVLPIEASLSPHDPLAKWVDHEACWKMQYRGSLGETLLHVLIICDTKVHTRLARTLLKCFPKQAVDVVEGEEYLGASALHLAIAYANNELVQDLVEAGANISQRAIGVYISVHAGTVTYKFL